MTDESIFTTALAFKTEAERQAYLDQVCADNPALRAEVEALLKADADAGSFLNHPPAGVDATIAMNAEHDTVDNGSQPVSLSFLKPCSTPGRLGMLVGKAGEYEVIEVVGQGGMGAVLRAFETKLSRIVAVKILKPELAANREAVKRFQREAQSAAAVHHDHVVTIHAVDETHQPPFIVMQFVEGQTLQEKIDQEGALELKQILRIGSQTAAGLAAAHKHGLIHRDVKPGNILLENGVERVKITDFGLARAADDLEMTQTGIIAGTPQYMSPEQAKGEPIDTRSDLFSLGSVLYSMCTGRPAFRADNTMAVMRRVCEDVPRPIREVNPEIPEWLCEIVDKLLEKAPERRFQSAQEVSDLLSQHLAHLQQPASCPLPPRVATRAAEPLAWQDDLLKVQIRGLQVAGVVSLLAGAFDLYCLAFRFSEMSRNWPAPFLAWFFIGGLLSLPQGLVILYGAARAELRQSQRWAVAAAVLSLVPTNIYLLIMLPLTIWTLVNLRRVINPEVSGMPKPQPAKAAKPDHLTPQQQHKRSLAIATLISLAISLPICVGAYLYRKASGPEYITVFANDPGIVVTVDGNPSSTSGYGGDPTAPIAEGGPKLVAFSAFRVWPGKHRVRALKGNQVVYDAVVDLQRGESKQIHIPSLGVPIGAVTFAELAKQAASADGWISLFNGKDLTGWKSHPDRPGEWQVKDGILVGTKEQTYLFSQRGDYEDFHLRLEARINDGGDSGIYFRSPFELAWLGIKTKHFTPAGGYEAELHKNSEHPEKTGSIFGLGQVADDSFIKPDEWFTLEVIADGNRFVTKVNGREAVSCLDHESRFRKGHLALQVFRPGTVVEFRKIEIKELPEPPATVP